MSSNTGNIDNIIILNKKIFPFIWMSISGSTKLIIIGPLGAYFEHDFKRNNIYQWIF